MGAKLRPLPRPQTPYWARGHLSRLRRAFAVPCPPLGGGAVGSFSFLLLIWTFLRRCRALEPLLIRHWLPPLPSNYLPIGTDLRNHPLWAYQDRSGISRLTFRAHQSPTIHPHSFPVVCLLPLFSISETEGPANRKVEPEYWWRFAHLTHRFADPESPWDQSG